MVKKFFYDINTNEIPGELSQRKVKWFGISLVFI